MFKLGILSQAKHNFKNLVFIYPKEPFFHYNYAFSLLKMDELNEALKTINVIKYKKSEIQKVEYKLL